MHNVEFMVKRRQDMELKSPGGSLVEILCSKPQGVGIFGIFMSRYC